MIEDAIWVLLRNCTMEEKKQQKCYSKITMIQNDLETQIERKKAQKRNNVLDFAKEHKFKLNGESLVVTKFVIQIKKGTCFIKRSKQF